MKRKESSEPEQRKNQRGITLYPLTVKQALEKMLGVKPPSKDAPEPKSPRKKADAP